MQYTLWTMARTWFAVTAPVSRRMARATWRAIALGTNTYSITSITYSFTCGAFCRIKFVALFGLGVINAMLNIVLEGCRKFWCIS